MRKRVIGLLLIGFVLIGMSSCKKAWNSLRKKTQATNREYVINQYSGGILIETYEFTGILNDSEGSDGYYFYKGDTLVEISGDLIIKSTR